ncbi:MAG: D-aminoacylase [bacterium]
MSQKTSRREFIKQTALAGLSVGFIGSQFIVGCTRREFDLLITGGTVYDGMGGDPFIADVGIKGDRIIAMGNLKGRTAPRLIDAAGLAVSPGFIDAHCHTDISLLVNPKAESIIRQGITTEVSGQCGSSPFPGGGPDWEKTKKNIEEEYEISIDWTNADGFLRRIETNRTAVNYVSFVGNGTIRSVVMGLEDKEPTREELELMKREVRMAMEQGAFGLSTGLEYTPSSFAKTEELIELSKVVSRLNGVYATHMRSEDLKLEEAVDEAIRIAKEADVDLQISHLKANQKRNWHKLPSVLERIARAGREGVRVHADRYTYTAWATSLSIMFPMWAKEGDSDAFVGRLKDDAQWKKMKPFVEDRVNALGSWESVLITNLKSEEKKSMQGKTVARLSDEAGKDPTSFARQLLIEEEGGVSICGFGMSDENTEKVLAFPLTMVGTDGDAVAPYGLLSKGNPHPRHYGTFPRYLGYYVREKKILPLQEAVRRITSMPADKFRIPDRGVIVEGNYADVVLFNPETVIDKATFTNPHQYPEGIDCVIVNGKVVIEKGQHTGELPGQVLRKT